MQAPGRVFEPWGFLGVDHTPLAPAALQYYQVHLPIALTEERIMTSPLQSLIACGTKLWLDSIDPDLVARDRALGATGATSNPIIIADLIKTGRFDADISQLLGKGLSDADVAWQMTDALVRRAQQVFDPVNKATRGDDGYVS